MFCRFSSRISKLIIWPSMHVYTRSLEWMGKVLLRLRALGQQNVHILCKRESQRCSMLVLQTKNNQGIRANKTSGSQCGFCTPGIVMSLYALIRNSYRDGRFHLSHSDLELEGHLDGNLCRCVSYSCFHGPHTVISGSKKEMPVANNFFRLVTSRFLKQHELLSWKIFKESLSKTILP